MTSRDSLFPQLYNTATTTGDITFVVGQGAKEFKAHNFIIANLAKPLYDIAMIETESADESSNDESGVVILQDTDEGIFCAILDSLYLGKMPDKVKSVDEGKQIIIACDKFGCIDLKLHAEKFLQKVTNKKNTLDLLLFAEAHTCPTLKDKAMEMYSIFAEEAIEANKDGWSSIEKHPQLALDLLRYICIDDRNRISYKSCGTCDDLKASYMRFNSKDLITVLRDKNLDIDGSREILLERLRKHLDSSITDNSIVDESDDESNDESDDESDYEGDY